MNFYFDMRKLTVILCIISAFSLLFGAVLFLFNRQKTDYSSVEAEIVNIETWYEFDTARETQVLTGEATILYTVDGVTYENTLPYSSDFNIGSIVEIYYDPAMPENIIYGSTESFPVFFAVSALCAAGAVFTVVKRRKEQNA